MPRTEKGQAALEYLMTYSWALVAIAIVIGVLIFMGILKAPSAGTCTGLEKLAYEDHTIDSNGNFILYLKNGAGMQIAINSISPGEDFSGNCSASSAIINATKDFNIVCINTGISAGQTYNGKITIEYMRRNAKHTESAACSGTAPLSGIFLVAPAPQIIEGFFNGSGNNVDLNNPDEMTLGGGGGSYAFFGSYTSDVFDANSTMDWTASISWDENAPAGTDINLQTRTSDNNVAFSAWSGYYTNPSGEAITSPNGRFIQYKANLSTTNPALTPRLLEVRMHGNPLAQSCGNLKREGSEQCDTNDLAGSNCVLLGYSSGALACKADCTFDTNGCVGATTTMLCPGSKTWTSQSDWQSGALANIDATSSPGSIKLSQPSTSGTWNIVVDSNAAPTDWNAISWSEDLNYGGELAGDANTKLLLHLNEVSGLTAADASGNGNNGTLTNGATWTSSGKFGNALGFDGINDYIDVSNESLFDFERTSPFTLSAWVKWASGTTQTLLSKQTSAGNAPGWLLIVNANGTLAMWLVNDAGAGWNLIHVDSVSSIGLGTWNHVVMTYDGSSTAAGVKLFINGNQSGTTIVTNTLSASILNNVDVWIGNRQFADIPFNGTIDEAAIWNRALGAGEILEHYKRGALNLRFRTRSAPTQGTLSSASWGGYYTESPSAIASPNNKWIEVQALLENSDANYTNYTPVLNDVSISCAGAQGNQAPFAGLGASAYSANAGSYIAFYGNTSYDPDGNIVNYAWNFGDGNAVASPANYPLGAKTLLRFDEGIDSAAGDASGNNNGGTISGAAWTSSGKFGNALAFDGVDDYVNLPQKITDAEGTISAWIKTGGDVSSAQRIYSQSTGGASSNRVAVTILSGAFRFDAGFAPGGVQLDIGNVQPNTWYHIVWTSDGSTIKGYVNGANQALTVTGGSNSGQWFSGITSNYARIGNMRYDDISGNIQYFNGTIDEVAIYNRALGAGEILALYQGGPAVVYHKYNLAGDYNVVLTVTDNNGATDANTVSVSITSGPISFCPGTKSWTTQADFNSGSDVNADTYSDPGSIILTKSGEIAPDANTKLLMHFNANPQTHLGTEMDSSGNGNNGTVYTNEGATNKAVAGKFGSALGFDGIDDRVSVPDSDYWNLGLYFTIGMWVKFQSGTIDNEHYLLGYNYGSNNRNFWVAYQGQLSPDQLHFNFATDGSGGHFGGMSVAWTPNAGQWYNIAIVRNSADLKMFIDGMQIGSTYNIGATSMWAGSTAGIEIGSGHNSRHSGEMDEVAVWNRALSPSEVLALYQSGSAYRPSGTWNGVFDSNSIASGWNTINWGEDLNYGAELAGDSNTKLLLHLNEGSGTTANDSSGNGNNGALFNGPIWTSSGKFRNALQFDGTDDYVKFSAANMPTGERTVELWFYNTDTTAVGARQIFGYGGNSNSPAYSSFLIYSSADKKGITAHMHYPGGGILNYAGTSPMTNAWYYLVLTTDVSGSRLYINGRLVDYNAVTPSTYVSGKDGFVGAMPSGSGTGTYVDPNYPYWKGNIDEVAVYNAALDANKILEHYRKGAANIRLRTRTAASQLALSSAEWSNENEIDANSDINGLWHFNEGSGSIASDSSGNGNNGTLMNGVAWASSGKFKNALQFDGVNDYVNIIKSDEFHLGAGSFAVTAWVNFAGLAGNQNILAFYTIANQALQFAWSTNVLTVWGETSTVLSTSGFSPTLNRWYHVAFVRNGNAWNIYVDGTSYASATDARTLNYPKDNIGIGVLPTSLQYFNGKIDELAIWNRGLSAGEVLGLYKRGKYYTAGPSAITSDANRFIEVQALLETENSSYTPVLQDLNISCS
ncbi:MAG: hypothetical protein HYW05_04375 [Candidatus Diapherotrites archaeon]|nr:hypothetical protein [Candidatus Diapherotrites archaeon]